MLERMLPAEARRHVAGLDLKLIVSAMLRDVDMARHERRLNSDYDRRRAGGELLALEEMYAGAARPAAEPGSTESPHQSEPDEFPWQMRREADALAALFEPPAGPEPPDCA